MAAEDPLEELTRKEKQRLADLVQGGTSRRDALKAGGALGLGAILGGGGYAASTQNAKADASTSDSDGNVGTPSNPVDVFAEGLAGPTGDVVDVGDSLVPDTDASYDLGTSSNTWNNGHFGSIETDELGIRPFDSITGLDSGVYVFSSGPGASTNSDWSDNGNLSETVSFNFSFSNPPEVVIQTDGVNGSSLTHRDGRFADVFNITTDGFDVLFRNYTTNDHTNDPPALRYVAIEGN